MKRTLSTWDITDALHRDDNGGWSYAGAAAMAEYLEDYEDSTGEEIELDVVAIRCDYSEYESAIEVAQEYGYVPEVCFYCPECESITDPERAICEHCEKPVCADDWKEEREERALTWLQERTTVITFDGGVIAAGF